MMRALAHRDCQTRGRRGVVLLIVLVVVAMLALGSYSFVQLMNTEARAAQMVGRQVQARHAADSGVHYAAAILLDQKYSSTLGTDVYDASSMFHGQLVSDETAAVPRLRCRFSAVAPVDSSGSSGSPRFGLTDEAGKINLNSLVERLEEQVSQSGSGTGGGGGSGTGGGSGSGTGGGSGSGTGGGSGSGTGGGTAGTGSSGTGETPANPLIYLPNMTQEIADAILDWLDPDDTPRQYGAESDFYRSLDPPYQPRNGPITNLDELLLVAGVTPQLLYGEDGNRNGILDANEDDGDLSSPADDANGTLDRGWISYLTLHSRESNTDLLGMPRIYLNNTDLQQLFDELSADADFGEERARFIVAYRLFGAASAGGQGDSSQGASSQGASSSSGGSQGSQGGGQSSGGGQGGQTGGGQGGQTGGGSGRDGGSAAGQGAGGQAAGQGSSGQSASGSSGSSQQKTIAGFDASGGAANNINSIMDLVGVTVNAKVPGQQQTTSLKSPFQESDVESFLDMLLDRATTSQKTDLLGRINVNTATWPALMSLPGMTESLGDAIVAARGGSEAAAEAMSNLGVAWLISSGAVTADQFKKMEPHITGQTQVFSIQTVGFFEEGGPVARVEAVIDVSRSSPRIRYWRDLTSLGRGFDPQWLMGTLSR